MTRIRLEVLDGGLDVAVWVKCRGCGNYYPMEVELSELVPTPLYPLLRTGLSNIDPDSVLEWDAMKVTCESCDTEEDDVG